MNFLLALGFLEICWGFTAVCLADAPRRDFARQVLPILSHDPAE